MIEGFAAPTRRLFDPLPDGDREKSPASGYTPTFLPVNQTPGTQPPRGGQAEGGPRSLLAPELLRVPGACPPLGGWRAPSGRAVEEVVLRWSPRG